MKAIGLLTGLIALAGTFAGPVAAQQWPTKPVRIVVPFAAGGATDALGRVLGQQLSQIFKQQFYVENKPGSGGATGSSEVARAAPDGYNLLISGVGSHVAAPAINPNIRYDPIKDFTHIAMLGGDAVVLAASPKLGVQDLNQLMKKLKSSPIPTSYATPAVGSLAHLMMENFRHVNALNLEHIAYKGGGQAAIDLLGGHLSLGLLNFLTIGEHVRSGAVLPIAISGPDRLKSFPNIPTFVEMGYPEMVGTTWFGLSGPTHMPPALVDRLNREVRAILGRPDVMAKLVGNSTVIPDMDVAAFNAFYAEEVVRWANAAKKAGLRLQN